MKPVMWISLAERPLLLCALRASLGVSERHCEQFHSSQRELSAYTYTMCIGIVPFDTSFVELIVSFLFIVCYNPFSVYILISLEWKK